MSFTPKVVFGCILILCCLAPGCRNTEIRSLQRTYVCTTPVTAMIVAEVAGTRGTVIDMLPPGASPHTYEPRPSDIKTVQSADALFSVATNLDGWASKLPAKQTRALIDFVPGDMRLRGTHHHDDHSEDAGDVDPHFWMDPNTVRQMVPDLVVFLSSVDPGGKKDYERNGEAFMKSLDELDKESANALKSCRGAKVALFHPSVMYMLRRYAIDAPVILEPSPGQEPSARDMARMVKTMRDKKVKAIFSEPQLPARPAEVLGEATGIPVSMLNPLGGGPDTSRYADLIRANVSSLKEALQ